MAKNELKINKSKHINFIHVKTLLDEIKHKLIYEGDIKNNLITSPILNRAGVQLATAHLYKFNKINSTVLWGTDEDDFFNKLMNKEKINQAIKSVIKLNPPIIILCNGFKKTKLIKEIAKQEKSSTTIVQTDWHSHQVYLSIGSWINEQLATYSLIHGTLLYINGIGVLIKGGSGIGKSEVALQLIQQHNSLFVADDAIEATNIGNKLFAKPSKIASTFLEVRGIGLINIERMLGVDKIKCNTYVDIIVNLVKSNNLVREYFERIGEKNKYENVLGVKIPSYNIPVTSGRDIANLICAAVGDWKLRRRGYNSAHEFMENSLTVNKEEK